MIRQEFHAHQELLKKGEKYRKEKFSQLPLYTTTKDATTGKVSEGYFRSTSSKYEIGT